MADEAETQLHPSQGLKARVKEECAEISRRGCRLFPSRLTTAARMTLIAGSDTRYGQVDGLSVGRVLLYHIFKAQLLTTCLLMVEKDAFQPVSGIAIRFRKLGPRPRSLLLNILSPKTMTALSILGMLANPETYFIKPTAHCPNNVLPLLVYRGVLPEPHDEESATKLLESHGWTKKVGLLVVTGDSQD